MWKTHFTIVNNGFVFHRACGNHCGKLSKIVEKIIINNFFHISTTPIIILPVEMWKT